MKFKLHSDYQLTNNQKNAVSKLNLNLDTQKYQVLLGVTGTGKTFTIANVIEKKQCQTLILVHNKTLAGQLYSELKQFFPENKVEYFVSNFDYYQPEAYLPEKNLYIDKTSKQNININMLRDSTISSLNSRKDTIVVASIAAIFGAYDPNEFEKMCISINKNNKCTAIEMNRKLISIGYVRNDTSLIPGSFQYKGTTLYIMFTNSNEVIYRIDLFDDKINKIDKCNYLLQDVLETYDKLKVFPGNDYVFDNKRLKISIQRIKKELESQISYFDNNNKFIEKQRINERVSGDIEALNEFGVCPGIENYSMHLDLRTIDELPYTLIDYFKQNNWLLIVDESHMTLPQIHGMYNNDRSRKLNLVNYGFRLPSALGNRPLNFKEFMDKIHKVIFVSATPGDYELNLVNQNPVLQIIRPTGLLDPKTIIENKKDQILKIVDIIKKCSKNNERVIVLTLTIRSAEEIVEYFEQFEFKSYYLHNELKTLERLIILNNLRKGKLDCVVGINLLREGLDLPEVSTLIILDADKEGFLRDYRSLIQMFGRVSRNKNGRVILFCEKMTKSMNKAIKETSDRRKLQNEYNRQNNIIPKTIIKSIMDVPGEDSFELVSIKKQKLKLTTRSRKKLINEVSMNMKDAAKNLDFEKAAKLRDILFELEGNEITDKNN